MKLTKEKYQSFKNIINIIESGDIHDKRYKLLIESLTIKDLDEMRQFIAQAEDYGIHLLKEIV